MPVNNQLDVRTRQNRFACTSAFICDPSSAPAVVPRRCPLVSALCSGIYKTNASVSHLVTHTAHTHTNRRAHAWLNATVSACLSNRVLAPRGPLGLAARTHTHTDGHTRRCSSRWEHAETHSEREISNMQTRRAPGVVDTQTIETQLVMHAHTRKCRFYTRAGSDCSAETEKLGRLTAE